MLPIIYEDKWLIAVNKPSGLLSVPGRYVENQDSVLSRLRNLLPDSWDLTAVHRLDWETSGILLLARDKETSIKLRQQFEKKQVHKVYEAVLSGTVNVDTGTIDLPLWGDPENRPYQQVNWECGKPSVTRFQVMAREGNHTRIEFWPLTGRTHQLRVHAADVRGLGIPILGDRLYGCRAAANRLHLHARELSFEHPRWEKGCTYRRRRHFKPRAIAQRAIIDREYVMSLALRAIDSSYPQKRSNSELPSFFS
jgi:tRNA pseudouridine32 synthase/23S rRNA pseudouridine746 synthase